MELSFRIVLDLKTYLTSGGEAASRYTHFLHRLERELRPLVISQEIDHVHVFGGLEGGAILQAVLASVQ